MQNVSNVAQSAQNSTTSRPTLNFYSVSHNVNNWICIISHWLHVYKCIHYNNIQNSINSKLSWLQFGLTDDCYNYLLTLTRICDYRHYIKNYAVSKFCLTQLSMWVTARSRRSVINLVQCLTCRLQVKSISRAAQLKIVSQLITVIRGTSKSLMM